MMNRKRTLILALGVCAAGIPVAYASMGGSSYEWLAGAGNWSNTLKWNPAGIPDVAGESATIAAAGTYTVTVDISPTIDSLLVSNATATVNLNGQTMTLLTPAGLNNSGVFAGNGTVIGAVTNNVGGKFSTVAGQTQTLSSLSLVNNGLFVVNENQAGATTTLHFLDNTAISGSGTIQLSQQGVWAALSAAAGKTVTNGASHTIQGRGLISAAMVNNGTVNANWTNQTLLVSSPTISNAGTLKAGGGTLRMSGTAITQSGAGQLFADTADIGLEASGSVTGGTLNSNAGRAIFLDGGNFTFANLTSNATVNIQAGRVLTIGSGPLANNGLININANQAGAPTTLHFLDNTSISGTGLIQMSQQGNWAALTAEAGKTVTNGSAHKIQGRGQIAASLINNGTIDANWTSQTLLITSPSVSNVGTMKAGGGTLRLSGSAITQSGAGQVYADTSDVGLEGSGTITGGTLVSNAGRAFYVDLGDHTLTTLTSNATVNVQHGRKLSIGEGPLVNNGQINVNYNLAGANTELHFLGNTTLSGSGHVQLSQQGVWAQLTTAVGKTLTLASGHLIKGRGLITASLVNNGTIAADWTSDTLELAGSAKTNNSTMKSSGTSSTLSIRDCTINQSPTARILAETSNVGIRGTATINGGRLESGGTFGHYVDNGAPTFNGVTNTGLVNIQHGIVLNVGALGLVNNGTFNVNYNQAGANTSMHFPASAVLSGTGLVQLSQNGVWADVSTGPGATITHAGGHTIQGRGQISGAMINNGQIIANWTGQTLELNGAAKTNNATIKSSGSGSTLSIRDCQVNQSPTARIFAETSDVGIRGSATITGGRLESAGAFAHYFDNGSPILNGVTNTGQAKIQSGVGVNIGPLGLVNNGTFTVNYNQAGSSTTLVFPQSAVMSGTGIVQLSQQSTWAHVQAVSPAVLTNEVGHTIQGRGQITGPVINKGNVFANWSSAELVINQTGAGFENRGAAGVPNSSSSLRVLGGDYKQTDGSTTVTGSMTVTGGNKVAIMGGTLKGGGTINAPVEVSGTGETQPGESPGRLTVNGTYSQGDQSTLTMELNGVTQVSQYDHLQVSGAVTLDGTLKIVIGSGFTPTSATTFTIVNGSAVSGQFDEVEVVGALDLEPVVEYNATSVTVTFLTEVDATSFQITSGTHFGGTLQSLFNSDNDYVFILCDESDPNGVIEMTTTSPFATITNLRFAFESASTRTDITEFVEFFNYQTNAWVAIPPTTQSTLNDRRRVLVQPTNPSHYVRSGDRQMKSRIRFIPFQDLEAADGWASRVDQGSWFVGD